MSWAKVDDGLHAHPKWIRATKGARALWTTALSWCSGQGNGGHIPRDLLRYLDGTPAEARTLVDVGLWTPTDDGWRFHEWEERNPDALSARAAATAQKTGGAFGSHKRWHVGRDLKAPGCEWCDAG